MAAPLRAVPAAPVATVAAAPASLLSSASTSTPTPTPAPTRYLNRELSFLAFQARVLALADDDALPVLERIKFLSIYAANLDEFFQVWVAGLKDQLEAGLGATRPDGMTPQAQLKAIRTEVEAQFHRMTEVWTERVIPALVEAGIHICGWEDLGPLDRAHLDRQFEERLFPVLTPLAVDPGHPFPHISDLSLNLAVMVRDPVTSERRFARVKVPQLLPRFVVLPDGERIVALEQVIAAHLDRLFPGMQIEGHVAFRVTRNADLALDEEEADDLLAAVELELRRRRRGDAVRLEVASDVSDEVRDLLVRELELTPSDVYVVDGLLDLSGLAAVRELDRPDLKDEPWTSVTQPRLLGEEDNRVDIFAVLRDGDLLVHHPYDSYATSVQAFIEYAAADPDVLAIKQTLYRTSRDSPIVKALIAAAEAGKQVAVLVEVKARFDEQANIGWAKALEDAGVHVTYGIVGLKTHSKTALVVRQEPDGIRRYCHVGTGNYNPRTARQYEDLGLLSADGDLGADLSNLFNYLTGYSRHVGYKRVIVAPHGLRDRMVELIDAEAAKGADGRIVMKMNGLDDPAVMDALYAASAAGTPIDLIIRSICCLLPGVPGLSSNIRVRSIVGRYLEHSRIFAFGAGETRYYIGSADMRGRNLDRRVEVVVPVDDPALRARLQEILDVNLADGESAWLLGPDGAWRPEDGDGPATQRQLYEIAVARARLARSAG